MTKPSNPTPPSDDVVIDPARTGHEPRTSRNDPHPATGAGSGEAVGVPSTPGTGGGASRFDRPVGGQAQTAGTGGVGGPMGSRGGEANTGKGNAPADATKTGDKAAPKAEASLLPEYPDTGHGTQEICLEGGATYRVGKPIPLDIAIGSDIYNLSDRAKGEYHFRVK